MLDYEGKVIQEVINWQQDMKKPGKNSSILAKSIQNKINTIIPDEAHRVITEAIKNMTRIVLKGSEITSSKPYVSLSLKERDYLFEEKAESFRKAATISGAGTGAGGLIVGLADFPILLSIKIKFLYDIALLYGYDISNFKERLYILYIFMLSFSSDEKRKDVYFDIVNFEDIKDSLPNSYDEFNWREFQQEYRDYIDISKMLQLLPIVGSIFGGLANYKLLTRLAYVSKNSYRYRILKNKGII
ncbi:MAG: EcsC family protein [Cetobacterium sp.]